MAARKGKKEKQTNKTPEVVQVDEQLREKELIPGKGFYESHWLRIQDKEEVDCFISGIIYEIFNTAFTEGHYKSCSVLALPYSVQWAKERMVEVIECYFLHHDSGQSAMDASIWSEDTDEPIPAPIDSWARGMMTIETELISETERQQVASPSSSSIKEEDTLELTDVHVSPDTINDRKETTTSEVFTSKPSRPVAHRQRNSRVMKVIDTVVPEVPNESQLNTDSHTSTLRSHTPPTPSMLLSVPPMMTTPYDPIPLPTNKRSDLVTDINGAVKFSRKLDSKKFPSPSIKPNVRVPQRTDLHDTTTSTSTVATTTTKKTSSRTDHTRHHMRWTNTGSNTLPLITNKTTSGGGGGGGLQRIDSSRFPRRPVLPFIVDLMDPVPGVTVTAQGRSVSTTSGHIRTNKLQRGSNLKPIKPQKVLGEDRDDTSKRNIIIRDRKLAEV